MELELDLKDMIKIFRKRLDVLIALPLIALITSLVFSYFILTPVYSSSTTLIVNKQQENSNSSIDYQSVMANQQIAKTYEQIAQSRTVMEWVKEKLKLDLTEGQIGKMVTVGAVGNTELIEITVNDSNPKRAKIIANAVAESFMTKIKDTMKVENVKTVDPAVENDTPIKPNKKLNAAIAFVLGIMLASGIILLINVLDNTIKTKEEVEEILGLPVLGTIPIIE